MKRLIAIVVMLILFVPLFPVFVLQTKAAGSETTIFQDNFESYAVGTFPSAGGWQLVYNGAGNQYQVITIDYSRSGSKSLQMMGQHGWSAVVVKDFSSSSNLIGFEAYLMGTPGSGPSVGFGNEAIQPWGKMYGAVGVDTVAGYIRTASQNLQACVANTWYKIRTLMDRNARTFNVWIDDQLIGSNIPESNNPWEIQSLRFDVGWANVKNYYDDVKVFSISGPPPTAPVISSVSPIAATNLQTIHIYGSGFGNTWPEIVSLGDGSVDTVRSATTPYMDICDSGKKRDTGDPSDGGNNWAAGVIGNDVYCMVGLIISSWTDTEIVLGGFGNALGTNGQGTWYINPGDPLVVSVFVLGLQADYYLTVSHPSQKHEIAILQVTPIGTNWWRNSGGIIEVREGQLMPLQTTVVNRGDFTETFDLHISYEDLETSPIKLFPLQTTSLTLSPGDSTIVTFDWNTEKSKPLTDNVHSHSYDVIATGNAGDSFAVGTSSKITVFPVLPQKWLLAPQHENSPATIKWEFPDNFIDDGSAAHNHRRNKPLYAFGTWNDREYTFDADLFKSMEQYDYLNSAFDTVSNPWFFYYGHGFIGSGKPLRYYFVDKSSWPQEAVDNVTRAFHEWSSLNDPSRPDLATGIFFTEVTNNQLSDPNNPGLDAEIVLCWRDLGNVLADKSTLGITVPYKTTVDGQSKVYVNITFNNRDPLGQKIVYDIYIPYYYYAKWYYGDPDQMPEGAQWDVIPVSYYHFEVPFYSVALHEIGHALGLPHISDSSSVLTPRKPPGARCASRIDGEAREIALDLYSIPAPYVLVSIHSPADLYVTDPLGRHSGFDPTAQVFVNQIPYAKLSDSGSEPESIAISWPTCGTYQIVLVGTAKGIYNLTVDGATSIPTYYLSVNGSISLGQVQKFYSRLEETSLTIYMPGDVNIDGKVDIRDVSAAARAFGSCTGEERWNGLADTNEDCKVDIRDIALIARNFGQHYP